MATPQTIPQTLRISRTTWTRAACAIAASVVSLGAPAAVQAQTCQPTWAAGAGPNIGDPGADDFVYSLTVFNDGTGPALYAGGIFNTAGGASARRVAKWDGSSWSSLGSGMIGGFVFALAGFDDGTGPALYVSGTITGAGHIPVNLIAKWDGSSWSSVGGGLNNGGAKGAVRAMTVFDDGTETAIYAGGHFGEAGGAPANYIAKWNGSSWAPLGSGVNLGVYAMTVFDDGNGPALYVGGDFVTAGGISTNYIAKWDGSTWSELGTGVNSRVLALKVFDDGSGPALYASGYFTTAGGVSANHVAKWDGASWSQLGDGVGGTSEFVDALAVFNDGSGPVLCAGGHFTTASGAASNHITMWDGISWEPLGTGMSEDGQVDALTVFDDGTGPALYAGGGFTTAGGFAASNIARYAGCLTTTSADLTGDGVVNDADLATLLTQWGCLAPANCPADLNSDGTVNGADLAILLTNWG